MGWHGCGRIVSLHDWQWPGRSSLALVVPDSSEKGERKGEGLVLRLKNRDPRTLED